MSEPKSKSSKMRVALATVAAVEGPLSPPTSLRERLLVTVASQHMLRGLLRDGARAQS